VIACRPPLLDYCLDVADREAHRPAEPQPGQLAGVGEGQDRAPPQAEHPRPGVDFDQEHRGGPGLLGASPGRLM